MDRTVAVALTCLVALLLTACPPQAQTPAGTRTRSLEMERERTGQQMDQAADRAGVEQRTEHLENKAAQPKTTP